MDHLALAQDNHDRPLCDGCGERTWIGQLSDDPDGRFCPDCQEVRADEAADHTDTDENEEVDA